MISISIYRALSSRREYRLFLSKKTLLHIENLFDNIIDELVNDIIEIFVEDIEKFVICF